MRKRQINKNVKNIRKRIRARIAELDGVKLSKKEIKATFDLVQGDRHA